MAFNLRKRPAPYNALKREFADLSSDSDYLNFSNLTDDFKVHRQDHLIKG